MTAQFAFYEMDNKRHSGVLIHEVIGSTFAEQANFTRIDFIQAVDGQAVKSKAEVFDLLSNISNGQSVNVTVLREGKALTLKI